MFGYNYKSVGWMVGCITVSSLYILWELRVSWLNSWSYHYDSFDWVGYRVGSIVNSWSCGCYIKENGWVNITKGLVISFWQCRDKIGWLYEYNNPNGYKMVGDVVICAGFWLYRSTNCDELVICIKRTFTQARCWIYLNGCVYGQTSCYNQPVDHFHGYRMVI